MQHSFTALSSGCHGDLQGLDFEEDPHTIISFRVCEIVHTHYSVFK